MDLPELPYELNKNKNIYLFCIIDHFSKNGNAFIIENKEVNTTSKYLKLFLKCNDYPEEIGSDNGIEFKNNLIENYLKENNITFIMVPNTILIIRGLLKDSIKLKKICYIVLILKRIKSLN